VLHDRSTNDIVLEAAKVKAKAGFSSLGYTSAEIKEVT
jgi:hypothetical protein